MKNKVLYIDPVSHRAHVNFNKLQLNSLLRCSDVSCVFKQGYSTLLGEYSTNIVLEIPSPFYDFKGNGLVTRIQYWRILRYLKRNIDFSQYDKVIYSYYEEISYFFASMPKGALLFNHVNIAGLTSFVKRWFYKRVSRCNTQLVFNERMKDYLNLIGVTKVEIVPHGVLPKFEEPKISAINEINIDLNSYSKVLFMPSATSANQSFVKKLLCSQKFYDYLISKNYLLIVKGNYSCLDSSHVLMLKHFLSDECYQYLLIKSDIIILAYHEEFINRVSGVLFECVSNEKNVIMSNVDGLLAYKDIFSDYPYFTDIESLIEKIDYYDSHESIYRQDYNRDALEPNYEKVLR